ncbi:hypothetical protein [Winogradskyella sp. 3972H.M.0a.05]|uniref:hypothetical protein n=1 Tax=Winogradskyella sp. 3972H.M.0a.05 TaxID=2950277 RepID=UPI003393CF92
MKTIRLMLALCMVTVFSVSAQKQLSKISKSINVDKDVTIDLNTSYVQIEVDTWNKNVIEVEAYIESDKLSKEELQEALERWDLEVEGSGDFVTIKSKGSRNSWDGNFMIIDSDYGDILKDLEIQLADMPELPELENLKIEFAEFPEMPELPEMPEMPELPELPEGVNSIHFDYDKYKKQGEPYLEKWSKEYEEKYGKEYKEAMKNWARKFAESGFQEKMEKWGEEYGKSFEGKWAIEMEEWGKKFGEEFGKDFSKKMEKWGKEFEKHYGKDFEKKMEERARILEQRYAEQEERLQERFEQMEERREEQRQRIEERREERQQELEARLAEREQRLQQRRAAIERRLKDGGEKNVKKTIKIKMPKGAKLNLNVRHGELKFSSVFDLKANLSHSTLLANSIDGSGTSIDASYSSILVDNWNGGTLSLSYVDDALLKNVVGLMLNSNSSDIDIDKLSGNAIIDGSFGELTVKELSNNFNNLNLILENSEAFVKLPNADYQLIFKGNRSKFNNEYTNTKTINSSSNANKTIMVNAKFSNVIMR